VAKAQGDVKMVILLNFLKFDITAIVRKSSLGKLDPGNEKPHTSL
jgi:hypothetical protein